MNPLGWLPLVLLLSAVLTLALPWLAARRARRNLGLRVAGLEQVGVALGGRLLYLHSPGCGACRGLEPQLRRLAQEFPERLIELDVTEHAELAERLGVRATPTFIRVEDGRVAEVVVGGQSEARMRRLLAACRT